MCVYALCVAELPQYLYEAGWCAGGREVIITQPRRLAAAALAARVAEEMRCPLGTAVGYTVRFDDCTSADTALRFMTDGMLLRRLMTDPTLARASVVILDEAHERSQATDILAGLLKRLRTVRPDLRLVVSSATMDAQAFADFFDVPPPAPLPPAPASARVGDETTGGSENDSAHKSAAAAGVRAKASSARLTFNEEEDGEEDEVVQAALRAAGVPRGRGATAPSLASDARVAATSERAAGGDTLSLAAASSRIPTARGSRWDNASVARAPSAPLLTRTVVLRAVGRTYPVTRLYRKEAVTNVIAAVVETVLLVHAAQPPGSGDILVFMPTVDSIHEVARLLPLALPAAWGLPSDARLSEEQQLIIAPLHASLPLSRQLDAIEPPPLTKRGVAMRKVVLATNAAETSLSLEGMTTVIDTGLVRVRMFDAVTGLDVYAVLPAAATSAEQRAGRAGRTRAGQVFHLYTPAAAGALPRRNLPDVLTTDLTATLLSLAALGVPSPVNFEWLEAPAPAAVMRALESLYAFGAIDAKGALTSVTGWAMSRLPADPKLAAMILHGVKHGCAREAVAAAAVLSVDGHLFTACAAHAGDLPRGKAAAALESLRAIATEDGDVVAACLAMQAWARAGSTPAAAAEAHIQLSVASRIQSVHRQLAAVTTALVAHVRDAAALGSEDASAWSADDLLSVAAPLDVTALRRAVAAGCIMQLAHLTPDGTHYRCIRDGKQLALLHPASVCAKLRLRPLWIAFAEVHWSTDLYLSHVTRIEASWIRELASAYLDTPTVSAVSSANIQVAPLLGAAQPPPPATLTYRTAAQRKADAAAAAAAALRDLFSL
ncbi:ATP-dependent RNA helicase [archaeon]|nr:MAG: ATP-dependent RNA helicase [archaeon]